MPVMKLLGTNSTDAMKVDDGCDSLGTFIRQAVGKEPLFSLSRTGDSPLQWIQLLHDMDQQEFPGWPLLAPKKVQMQKCDKCSREFSSTINYRRHKRVHRRSMNFHKDPQKYRDLLGAFWDKKVTGSSIVWNLSANLRKAAYIFFPQVYVKAGSDLVDIIQGSPSRLSITSQELFSILDNASERTFLCAGTAESLQKYVFDGDAEKIGLQTENLIACTSFLVERKLVKACLAYKDAEALRCQKLLFEEEEAVQRRQAKLLERKRQRKLRQKEQRLRDQLNGAKVDAYVAASDIFEATPSEADPYIPDENVFTPLDSSRLSNNEDDIHTEAQGGSTNDQSSSTTSQNCKHQKIHKNGFQPFVARWQGPDSQKGGRNNINGDHKLKREQAHKHREQRAAVSNGSKVWTKKHKPENGSGEFFKMRVQNDAVNQTDQSNCQLMIGSISVTVRNSRGQQKVDNLAEIQDTCNTDLSNCSTLELSRTQQDTTYQLAESSSREAEKEADETMPTLSYNDSCELNGNNSEGTNASHPQMEDGSNQEGMPFSVPAAKAFLAQRWKEAASGDHVKLVISSSEPPCQFNTQNNHYLSESQERVVLANTENRLENMVAVGSPTHGNVKPQYRTKPKKGMKTKYIPKQRPAN
ncbi:Zinc finger, C2H2 [Artemisia annua]|uniref:Zinc finger, C2H2 n=1 Tax=Artemisia annua TaxID=35608 RepID=A0A2U1Q5W7_ARTAN|nr:Zinc finger, C2H2 [Artemisia annua]